MVGETKKFDYLLKGARVIDLSQDLDEITNLAVLDGRIGEIAKSLKEEDARTVIDCTGKIVTPGLIDIHLHAYGGLSFSDVDSVGVYSGVTTVVDAGGSGALTFPELKATLLDTPCKTDIYCYLMLRAAGAGVDESGEDRDVKKIITIPIADLVDMVRDNRRVIRALKVAAYSNAGTGVVKLAKGLAEVLGLPLYLHIGDIHVMPKRTITSEILSLLHADDIVTHCYTGTPGGILDKRGQVWPSLKDALKRGVRLDVGFGGFNFTFEVARKALEQDIVPFTISSDLQMVNVTGPVYSLANIMSIFMALGFDLQDVIRMTTLNAAKAIGLEADYGTLHIGHPADITVSELREGNWRFRDCEGEELEGRKKLVPVIAFKRGEMFNCDLEAAQHERNWNPKVSLEAPPKVSRHLLHEQRSFLAAFLKEVCEASWQGLELHYTFQKEVKRQGIALRQAVEAVHKSFMEDRFTPPVGWFLAQQDRQFALKRLMEVSHQVRND